MDPADKNNQELMKKILLTTGTVTLPGPFPDLAEISLEEDSFRFGEQPQSVLCLQSCPEPHTVVSRRVLLRDVLAIFIPNVTEGKEIKLSDGLFESGEGAAELIKQLSSSGPVRGLIYVREDTAVLMSTLSGMPASDSQAYYCGRPCCD